MKCLQNDKINKGTDFAVTRPTNRSRWRQSKGIRDIGLLESA